MAKIKFSPIVIEEMLFCYSPNRVKVNYAYFQDGNVVFDISGPDVPDCEEVMAENNKQQNRAGQQLLSMTFKEIERKIWEAPEQPF